MSDHAERWVYRLGAAAPLIVPWLIAPFESTLREGRRHVGTTVVGLLWGRPAAAYRRAAAWIPALFALLVTLLQLGLEWPRVAAFDVVLVFSIAAAMGYWYAALIILIGYAVREHAELAPRPPAA